MRKISKLEAKLLRSKGEKIKSTKNGYYTIGY
ncbi:hypothetical protein SAMN04488529_101691 [Clostridium gasigenes]|uniref:Uncharacterized protein n=1 Tax=Clostridium gasigenes TaxID=94869 RepID=A0A1H0N4T1_9CLOT|nr:hypothetical protein SAMN04488529_101691 [Clostridium gasigenes]